MRTKIILGGIIVALVFLVGATFVTDTTALHDSSPPKVSEGLPKTSLSLTQLFEQTEKGVVSITVKKSDSHRTSDAFDSGFVYDDKGHIITNNHVVANSEKITVTFVDGESYYARIIGTDIFADIAVLKIDDVRNPLYPLHIGDSSDIKVGQQIAAIGNPYGLSGSMTAGIISQIGRTLPSQETSFSIPDVIQTDAAINPGNSGGPLLDMNGDVIGINTAIQSTTGYFTGVGFAIPSKTVSKIVPVLIEDGKYKHPWIGISGSNISPELADVMELDDTRGFLVVTVVDGGPADKAGMNGSSQTKEVDGKQYLIGGDIVLGVDDKKVRGIEDILAHLQHEKNVGDKMSLKILRDGIKMEIVLVLEERMTPQTTILEK